MHNDKLDEVFQKYEDDLGAVDISSKEAKKKITEERKKVKEEVRKKKKKRLSIKRQQELSRELIKYYRANPDIACEELLGIKLNAYQKLALRLSWHTTFPLWCFSRGTGKSFLSAIFVVLKAILYPNMKIGILAPSGRQAFDTFGKIVDIYNRTACDGITNFLVEETLKEPSLDKSEAKLKFKNGSQVSALPLGHDGATIRGKRFNVILLDEYAYLPEIIVSKVIKPFLISKRGYVAGQTEAEYKKMGNQILICSTANYSFNHYYHTYRRYVANMIRDPKSYDYVVLDYDFTIGLQAGLFDRKILADQKRSMTEDEFSMEYLNIFVKEGVGQALSYRLFQKNSILDDEHKITKDVELFKPADFNGRYVLAVDPARVSDNFALHVFKLAKSHFGRYEKHLVKTITLNKETFQTMRDLIRQTIEDFGGIHHIANICIDAGAGGGGYAVRDLLAETWKNEAGQVQPPLLDVEDEEFNDKFNDEGVHLVRMIKPSTQMNNQMFPILKRELQQGMLLFPVERKHDPVADIELTHLEILATKQECTLIHKIPLANGFKYDLPKEKQGKSRKDRFSALMLGIWGIKLLEDEEMGKTEEDDDWCIGIRNSY